MTAAAADFDDDGWTDIYVASDSTAAILYRNNRDGTFTDVAVASGAAYNDTAAPRQAWAWPLATYNARRSPRPPEDALRRRHPGLYRKLGKGLFEDVAMAAGSAVQNRHVEWGAGMPDLDNDGRPDVALRHRQRLSRDRGAAAAVSSPRSARRVSQPRWRKVRGRDSDAAGRRRRRRTRAAAPRSATSTTTAISTSS